MDGSRDRDLAHVDVEPAQTLGEDAEEFGFPGVLEADAVDSRKLRESIGLCRTEYAPASKSSMRVGPNQWGVVGLSPGEAGSPQAHEVTQIWGYFVPSSFDRARPRRRGP